MDGYARHVVFERTSSFVSGRELRLPIDGNKFDAVRNHQNVGFEPEGPRQFDLLGLEIFMRPESDGGDRTVKVSFPGTAVGLDQIVAVFRDVRPFLSLERSL